MNFTYFIFFLAILSGTLIITHWAAKRGTTTHQYYSAAGQLTGFQNGLAISGDYMSAASFLGTTGAIALRGFDGFLYSIGFLVSYLLLLFVIAEPVRNLGQFTLGDVIARRFPGKKMRLFIASSTLIITILYIIPQLVASGLLIRLLLGTDYAASVFVIGSLMTVYVVFGGMIATSWVQIVKTVLLMAGTLLLTLIVLARFQWHLPSLLETVSRGTPLKDHFFYPGNLFTDPLEAFSLSLALILGTAGLPHILIRFFTVKDAPAVRQSVVTAIGIIGSFYLLTLLLGFGAVALVGWQQIVSVDPTGNLTAPLLALTVGGDFLMAFIAAVAFTTILAVVTGLLLSATSSFAHDVYNCVLKNGSATEREQLRVAKLTAVTIGFVSTVLSLGLESVNVAFLVGLTFVVAASTNLPVLLMTFYWKRFTATGVVTGMLSGLCVSLLFVLYGPHLLGKIPLYNPGIVAIPCGFLGAALGAWLSRGQVDEAHFDTLALQGQTGMYPPDLNKEVTGWKY
ncbi:solute symporter family protein [Numidum massiliense]|uniref:solute symporter family protein n=1 Tax=Numidum massiliense TaxID=1522315 RepID=UPI0006D57C68|nr:cation acetate symporter [Numidum massiliense]